MSRLIIDKDRTANYNHEVYWVVFEDRNRRLTTVGEIDVYGDRYSFMDLEYEIGKTIVDSDLFGLAIQIFLHYVHETPIAPNWVDVSTD